MSHPWLRSPAVPETDAPNITTVRSSGRLARNVLANWIWYALVVVSGFVLPRFIDREQGQALLGVWDLGWSLVFYVSLLALGVSAAVQRYVARFRAVAAWDELNSIINSSLALLTGSALLGLILAAGLAVGVRYLLPEADAGTLEIARWVVMLLCTCAALQIPGAVFNAVITGYERYDVLNLIRGVRDLLVIVSLLTLLLAGFGLVALAAVVLAGELLGDVAKFVAAGRLCPTLRISPALCQRSTAREMIAFGGKAALQDLARTGIYQANSILVAFYLGPATLAIYARQRALVMHLLRFVKQYAQVFVPTSSTLDAQQDTAALRHLLIQSSKYGLYVTLPIVLILVILGGPLLQIWMGADYQAPVVLAVLALAHLLAVPQLAVYALLLGMGRHGRPAVYELLAAVVSVAAGIVILGPLDGGMLGAALALALPIGLNSGIVVPLYACRCLNLSPRSYIQSVVPGPVLASVPLAACLLLARWSAAGDPLVTLGLGLGTGGLVTAAVYWRWVVPEPMAARVRRMLGQRSSVSLPAVSSSKGG